MPAVRRAPPGALIVAATARDLGQPVAAIAGAWTSLGLAAVIEL